MTKATIGIILEDGHVARVVTNDGSVLDTQIVIIENGEAAKIIEAHIEESITRYVSAAREANLLYFFGTAAEVAGDALVELSKRRYDDPVRLLTEIEGVMGQLVAALRDVQRL